MTSAVTLREQALAKLFEARAMAEATDTEQAAFDKVMGEFRSLDRQAKSALGATFDPVATLDEAEQWYTGSPSRGHAANGLPAGAPPPFTGSPGGRGRGGAWSLGSAFVEARQARHGFSAATPLLEPGSTAVATSLRSAPFLDPRQATFLAQLFGEEDAPGGQFSYMKQTLRTLAAAVVAPGARKPVSAFQYRKVSGSTDVIAHVSDPINRFDIQDAPSLRTWIDREMAYGLDLALDALVVAAVMVDATPGSATIDLAGLRGAITTLQLAEIAPNAIAMGPEEWETIETGLTTTYVGDSDIVQEAVNRRLYGLPVMVTTSLTDTAIVGRFGPDSGTIFVTGGIQIDVSDSTPREVGGETVSDFVLNQVIVRAERRAKPAIGRPTAFVTVGAGAGS